MREESTPAALAYAEGLGCHRAISALREALIAGAPAVSEQMELALRDVLGGVAAAHRERTPLGRGCGWALAQGGVARLQALLDLCRVHELEEGHEDLTTELADRLGRLSALLPRLVAASGATPGGAREDRARA
jgi:hypothetical protein